MVIPITLPMSCDKSPQRFFLFCTSAVTKIQSEMEVALLTLFRLFTLLPLFTLPSQFKLLKQWHVWLYEQKVEWT